MPNEPQSASADADVLIVGGGLASSLIALRLKAARPAVRVVVLEREPRLGGEHTWCHFATDLDPGAASWLEPLIAHRWDGYEVRFPDHARTLSTSYRAVTSERLHAVMIGVLGENAMLEVDVTEVRADQVRLADGRRLFAPLVIDARGPRRSPDLVLAWQKFIGREVRLAKPHGLTRPIVMDATVPQTDGYRFFYVLPLAPDRLLIEDTRYADRPALDQSEIEAEIDAYASRHGWRILEVARQEQGVLPIALAGDIDAYWKDSAGLAADAGLRAALFHPTTGYSLPDAARQAEVIANLPELTTERAREALIALSKRLWARRDFYRLLNRMLFKAARPDQRYRVLQRFYRLPQPLIERFYAGRSTAADKVRILAGKPPVPIGAALSCLSEKPLLAARAHA